jgi:hypothetical protein
MPVSLGPYGTLVTTWNRAHYCEINIRDAFREHASPLSWRNETHLFLRASAFSLLKETLAFNLRLLHLDERARSWGPPVRTGNGLYSVHYIVGIFVTGFPNEARYSLVMDYKHIFWKFRGSYAKSWTINIFSWKFMGCYVKIRGPRLWFLLSGRLFVKTTVAHAFWVFMRLRRWLGEARDYVCVFI